MIDGGITTTDCTIIDHSKISFKRKLLSIAPLSSTEICSQTYKIQGKLLQGAQHHVIKVGFLYLLWLFCANKGGQKEILTTVYSYAVRCIVQLRNKAEDRIKSTASRSIIESISSSGPRILTKSRWYSARRIYPQSWDKSRVQVAAFMLIFTLCFHLSLYLIPARSSVALDLSAFWLKRKSVIKALWWWTLELEITDEIDKLDGALTQYYIIPNSIEKGMSIPYKYEQGNPKSSDSGNLSLSIWTVNSILPTSRQHR